MFDRRMALTVLVTVLITLSMQSSNVTAVVKEPSSQWQL